LTTLVITYAVTLGEVKFRQDFSLRLKSCLCSKPKVKTKISWQFLMLKELN